MESLQQNIKKEGKDYLSMCSNSSVITVNQETCTKMNIEINTFAPVLIPTLNRFEHLKRCVDSLAKCTHAKNTELFIGLDYPPSEKYVDGWKRISEYVNRIDGFKKITIIRRDYNYGAVANYMDLIQRISNSFDRFIFTEDDNVFSPNFLDYINKGLEIYKDNPRVLSICGYNYPIDMTGYDRPYYFSHETSAWGVGRWTKKYDAVKKIISEPGFLIKQFRDLPLSFFLKNNTRMCKGISHIGYELREDVYMSFYNYKNDVYSLFPTISLVKNIGQDGSGLHSSNAGKDSVYQRQVMDSRENFDFNDAIPVGEDTLIKKQIVRFFTNCHLGIKIKRVSLLLLIRAFVKIRDFHC